MSKDRLKGTLVNGGPPAGPQLGALGEYRVDLKGLWRSVTGPLVAIGDGERFVEVKLHGWCEYKAIVRGTGGAMDVLAVPLHYREPKQVLPPTWTAGHRATVDMEILAVVYIRPANRPYTTN